MIVFKSAKEVSEEYNIPLSTVYQRIRNHTYRTNDRNEILLADVEKAELTGVKRGRPRK